MTRKEAKEIVLKLTELPHDEKFMYAVDNCDDAVLIVQAKYLLGLQKNESN